MTHPETYNHSNPITDPKSILPSSEPTHKQTITDLHPTEIQNLPSIKRNHLNFDDQELQNKVNQFLQSKIQLNQIQTDQNHDQFCVCPDCVHERNLIKPSHTLFNLTMRSIYKQDFKNDSTKKDQKTNKLLQKKLDQKFNAKEINEKQFSLHPKNTVSLQTVYNAEMTKSTFQPKRQSLKSVDLLKFDGPFSNLTTYKQKFPGITGANQYVKPVKEVVRDSFSLNAKTINQTFYKGQLSSRSNLAKSPDSLKTGLPMLFKQTTSQKFYSKPKNPEEYNSRKKPIVKDQGRRSEYIKDIQQFNSTYRKSFNGQDLFELAKMKKKLIRDTWTKLGMITY